MRNPANTRTCAGCGKKAHKDTLIRIGKSAEGIIAVGGTGRGAYLCKNADCLNAAIKKKRINSILHAPVPEEIYSELINIMGSDED